MTAWLMSASGVDEPDQVLAAIEVPHGPVVEALIERGFKVHAVNPKQMDRFRDRFTMSGAKDDSRDAEVMASSLRTDPRCFRALAPADPTVVELREWSRIGEDLGIERNRLANRLRTQLWRYFPALLDLEDDLGAEGQGRARRRSTDADGAGATPNRRGSDRQDGGVAQKPAKAANCRGWLRFGIADGHRPAHTERPGAFGPGN